MKKDDEYVFQTAKNGLELGGLRRRNVAVTICYCGIVDCESVTNLSRFFAPSAKQRIGLEK